MKCPATDVTNVTVARLTEWEEIGDKSRCVYLVPCDGHVIGDTEKLEYLDLPLCCKAADDTWRMPLIYGEVNNSNNVDDDVV